MTLLRYNQKRNFKKTPEPKEKEFKSAQALRFVVQKHDASHLHYDFRLEMEKTMKSWAIPKGPSMDPIHKRLAVQVEDHPMFYNSFEGHIPKGLYGGGDVIVWDNGTYHSLISTNAKESEKEFMAGLQDGKIQFVLNGKKLKGSFSLFRFKDKKQWLLVKLEDEYASPKDITEDPRSVISKKVLIGTKEDPEKYSKK